MTAEDLHRAPADAAKAVRVYDIDISGTCNLRCPSCPVGGFRKSDFVAEPRARGFMNLALFESILDKIAIEHQDVDPSKVMVEVFNWGEPLLHPKVADFIVAIKRRGFVSFLSTNFSIETDFSAVVRAAPDWWRISMSGLTQPIYGQTHKRGQAALVVSNLYRLRHWMDKYRKSFQVDVHYHLYRSNLNEDFKRTAELCQLLGFRFDPNKANYMSIEKNLAYFGGKLDNADDRTLVDNLLLRPEESSDIAKRHNALAPSDCKLRRDRVAINHDGSVLLCSAVYDPSYIVAQNYLDVSLEELQTQRYDHPLCTTCYEHGLQYNFKSPAELSELNDLLGERFNQFSIYKSGPNGISFD